MGRHLEDYYRHSSDGVPTGNFHDVIALHKSPQVKWDFIKDKTPELTKGWYELAHLNSVDRVNFLRDFWLSKIPYRQGLDNSVNKFFESLDDVGVYLIQKKFEDPFNAYIVYSIKNDGGFFKGAPPASDKDLIDLQKAFPSYIFPNDYFAFLQIHNGFCKATDCTGITSSEKVLRNYEELQNMIQQSDSVITSQNKIIDPKALIPFYESFGMPFYQCFWAEWYPDQEMGNVYYSAQLKTISSVYTGASNAETMAFATFTDWLMFYLESVE